MKEDEEVRQDYCTRRQAERTAWKNKHDLLDVMLADVREQNTSLAQLLLGFGVTGDGRTAYERIVEDRKLLE